MGELCKEKAPETTTLWLTWRILPSVSLRDISNAHIWVHRPQQTWAAAGDDLLPKTQLLLKLSTFG